MSHTIDDIILVMKRLGLALPQEGTGRNGAILKDDLINTVGEHYAQAKYGYGTVERRHLAMRLACKPMKAYRYNKLKQSVKDEVWKDSNKWIAEEKYNGWRIQLTYIPGHGFMVWGGNVSDVDFLPVDYTDKVRFKGLAPNGIAFRDICDVPFMLDSECLCYTDVEKLDGMMSIGTLDAVGAILGCDKDRAIRLQKEHELKFKLFDLVLFVQRHSLTIPLFKMELETRQKALDDLITDCFDVDALMCFSIAHRHYRDKKSFCNELWREGGEGVVLKNLEAHYSPGSRRADTAIKVKRSMSGEIGDDIDAYISGFVVTSEWELQNLIGGIRLSVKLSTDVELEIATVSSMPLDIRKELTVIDANGCPVLNTAYYNKVLVVDGQELSGKNKRLMHARVDWIRGFRLDKSKEDCRLDAMYIEDEEIADF